MLLFGIIFGMSTFIFNRFFVEPEYESSASVMIGVDKEDSSNSTKITNEDFQYNELLEYDKLQVNKSLMSTYSEVIKSKDLTNDVIETLNLEMDYDEFLDKVSISRVNDTQVISIDVIDSNPQRATDIANETATVFKKLIHELFDLENIRIIDMAYPPKSPSSPNIIKNSITGIVIGLFIGVFISITRQLVDDSFKNESEFYRELNIPVLGMIPNKKEYKKDLSLYDETLFSVRTNIELGNLEDKNKVIAITSSKPSEGKTTVLYDLAKSFAKNGHKVIILDCNLRMPKLKEMCNIDSNVGITDILLNNLETNKAIIKDKEDNLYVLPAGKIPENPTQLLSSDNFKDLISSLSSDFDYIFIDTPPVGIFTDAAIISTLCDGVILTVKSKDTTKEEVSLAVNNLKKVNANILGAILTFSDVVYETYKECLK